MAGVQKLKIQWAISLFLMLLYFSGLPAQAQYGDGDGTAENPYLIYTAEQMNAIGAESSDWNKHFKLMADIDLSSIGTAFNIIGTSGGKPFSGVFDGDGHSISSFECGAPDIYGIGLFAYVNGQNAQIKNLRLIDPVIHAETEDYVGLLIGRIHSGTITACSVENGFVYGDEKVGGLIGFNNGLITQCYSTATVSGTTDVGGLVGENFSKIINCYSSGIVSGNEKIGGLVGNGYNPDSITNCYSTTQVSGTMSVGGLVGTINRAKWSFWDIETSGQTDSGGGTGLTTAEMKSASTFIGYWGCDPVWTIDEGADYPRLAWQNMSGELIIKPSYAEGSGTEADPYLIYTAEQLNMIGLFQCDWDKHFKLMANIDLSQYKGTDFNTIGYASGWWASSENKYPFTGVFDGNGRTISNFSYSSTKRESYIGIFGYTERATIKNLYLIDPNINIESGEHVGSLVGFFLYGTITACYVQGGNVWGASEVSGLVGNNYGTISECASLTEVLGGSRIGGLVGYNGYGTIGNCYSLSNVTGINTVGGLVGICESQASIFNSYSAGSVQGTENVGGLLGLDGQGKILHCFWDIETSGQIDSAGGEGKTTAEMQTASTFIGWGPYAVWTINKGLDYPRLLWENMPGGSLTTPSFPSIEGSGTQDDPYLIYTAEQFNLIGLFPLEWDKHFKLMADIDLAEYTATTFNVTGCFALYPASGDIPFSGAFDGNGYTISNFNYTGISGGVFGWVKGAEIKNLTLIDPNINSTRGGIHIGSLVGYLYDATVKNCHVEGGYVSGGSRVGGLVGENCYGTITDCSFKGIVSNASGLGGLVGWNRGTITNSYFIGEVSGEGQEVGGLVGFNTDTINNCETSAKVSGTRKVGGLVGTQTGGRITGCYAAGSVTGTDEVGGFIGGNNGRIANSFTTVDVSGIKYVGGFAGQNGLNLSDVVWSGHIHSCYATGNVIGQTDVGGLVGYNDRWGTILNCYSAGSTLGDENFGGLVGQNRYGDVINSFWDMETSGLSTSAEGTSKTTTQMQEMSTFVVWACDAVWTIDEGSDYPRLVWEEMPGVPITKSYYGGGSGTETDPYLIYAAEQLNEIGLFTCDWDKHFKLMADIDLSAYSGTDFNIIGFYAGNHNYNNIPFTGVFDGNGHTIANFTYVSTDKDRIGLFVYLDDPNAQIKNLGLIDPNINVSLGYHTGSLVGIVESGSIISCFVEGGHVSGDWHVGGLVGSCYGNIHDCDYSGNVTGNHNVGGLAGRFSSDGTISDSTTIVTVTGSWAVGGLVGENYGRKLTNCLTTGTVTGDHGIGGLVGNNAEGEINDCNSAASVQGGDNVGGLAGASWGTITQCCTTGNVSGNRSLGGLVGYNCGPLTKCFATGSVKGNAGAGGLAGINCDVISYCYSNSNVSVENDVVGGLVGNNSWDSAAINNSYATGNIEGTNYVGGLAGYNRNIISKCYSTGKVSGIYDIGGLVGDNSGGSIIVCFWDVETSGLENSDGGNGKTTAEMQTESTFTDAGWDFMDETENGTEDIWWILEGQDYPRLWWELTENDSTELVGNWLTG